MDGRAPLSRLLSWRPAGREARDTLFMLAVIAWTIAPHLLRLDAWVGVLCLVVLFWRGVLALRQGPLPSRWWLVAIVALAAGLTLWTQRTLVGKDAGVTLLVVLMALKTLELRARRDALVVFFLGFFLVLTQFLYSQSLATAMAMGLSVWGWLTALTLAHMPAGRPRLADAAALAGRAALVGTPVMVALFLLFPRIGPLWAMPGGNAKTGLSDNLQLGDVAQLANNEEIAFRLRFEGNAPPAEALYFRGPVLSDYDGLRWRPNAFIAPGSVSSSDTGASTSLPVYRYEMTLEPLRIPWLPLLEGTRSMPEAAPALTGLPSQPDADGQWRLPRPVTERVLLKAEADLATPAASELRPFERRMLLTLPADRHPRTRAWAASLLQQPAFRDADASTLVQAVLQHIRSSSFVYTLEPGRYDNDPIDEFWLDRREGFCEHYAATFVVVMRAFGIPARIVTGYQGTDVLPIDGYYAVRQSHAHAWAEFWQPGKGWMRADPTGAVAPERIRHSLALEPAPGLFGGALQAVNPDLRQHWRRWVEALDNRWNQWILGYGKRQQFDFLSQLGFQSPDLLSLARLLVALVVGVGVAGAAWAWFDARRLGPWPRLQQRIARQVARLGIEARPSDTLATLARRLRERCGESADAAARALLALETHRYGRPGLSGTPPGWWREFRDAIGRAHAHASANGSGAPR
jgi:transglutaminase-like putative cysteine protease